MSAKSLGYTAISIIPDGTYSSAKITIDADGQILKLDSQAISPEGEGLQEEFDDLVSVVENSQSLQTATQVLLKSLETSIPAWNINQNKLIEQVNQLQNEYDLLESKYEALTPRFTPELVLEKTPFEMAIGSISQGVDNLIDTYTLEAGTYTIFFNAVGTFNYISNLPVQPPNPYTASFTADPNFGFIDDDNWGLNSMCASFVVGSELIGTISTSQFSVSGTPDSTTAAPQVRLVSVINGSTTFQLLETSDVKFNLRWNNSSILYFATSESKLDILGNDSDSIGINNVPVIQSGKSFSIWKVAN